MLVVKNASKTQQTYVLIVIFMFISYILACLVFSVIQNMRLQVYFRFSSCEHMHTNIAHARSTRTYRRLSHGVWLWMNNY